MIEAALRISIGKFTTIEELKSATEMIAETVNKIQKIMLLETLELS
jgi:cysteine sulfinate desulfinase/cysteine desulfurase-like protein